MSDLFEYFLGKEKYSPKSERSEEIEKSKKRPSVLSYSQINTYQKCPLKYKFQYLERRPSKPSPHLDFGKTIHDTLEDFHKEFDPRRASLEDLLNLYEENWVATGYRSKEEEQEFKREGERMLRDYYQTALKSPNVTIHLEKKFKFWIGDCEIWGKIDRIDRLPDGGWEIIDYKTGKRRIDEVGLEADLNSQEIDENFQLSLYYLACKEKFKKIPEKVSLYYLKYNQKISATRRPEQLRDVERIVAEVAFQIREKRFEPKKGPLCPWCDYKKICPVFKKAPPVEKRIKLSYSRISQFQRCPARYRALYIDEIPPRPKATYSFGGTIHKTLEEFYRYKKGEPSLDYLLELYKENWINLGFEDKEKEERYYQKGLKLLTNYYHDFIKDQYHPTKYLKKYFELPLGEDCLLTGYLERVDELSHGEFELIVYRMESYLPSPEEIENDLEFTIYYWAAPLALGISLDRLSLHHLCSGKKLTTSRGGRDVERLQLTINHMVKEIREARAQGDFPRRMNRYCGACNLDCPLKEEGIRKYEGSRV